MISKRRVRDERPHSQKKRIAAKPKKTPRSRKPENMDLEEWQIALRREFGREQKYRLKNLGEDPVFSRFEVTNPQTGKTYRVEIRGNQLADNYCSCPDFAVNTLGTCKHIEFTLSKLERKRGGKAALSQGFHPDYSEIYLLYGAKRKIAFRPGTKCPSEMRKLAERYFDPQGFLKDGAENRIESYIERVKRVGHDIHIREDVRDFIAQLRDQAERKKRIIREFPGANGGLLWKSLLKASLYPYQKEGSLFAARAGRCIIADDMGLGKTIQAIAASEILARIMGVQRVLVICPTSLKHQWRQEIDRFSGRSAVVVEGLFKKRTDLYQTESFYKIVNYEIVHQDRESIERWAPDLIVLDEAQRIKNWKTRRAKSVKQLSSEYAIVLTGTPLENRLEELHSIVEFVDRYHLGPLFRFLAEHQETDLTGRVVGYRNLSGISQSLEPILIRRHKEAVLKQLPERLDKRFFVPMTEQQRRHHEENREIVGRIVNKWRRCGFLSEQDQRRLMIALQFMRMVCNSTYLLDPETDHGYKADEVIALLDEIFEQKDAKVVIFSQWLGTHELLLRRFESKKWGSVFFHGGVPSAQRKELIRRFKTETDCRVFLSTDAGGVGLNLQNANVVINMDQPWNPAILEQRIGRVHRLGQHRPVRVVDFVSKGTIEQGMLDVLKFKKSLFSGVLDGGEDRVSLGGTRLKRFMESVDQVTQSIPEPMPEPSGSVMEDLESILDQAAAHDERSASMEKKPSVASVRKRQGWEDAISAGFTFAEKLLQALLGNRGEIAPGKTGPEKDSDAISPTKIFESFVERDAQTGQGFLKIPMPTDDALEKIAGFVESLLKSK